MDIITEQLNKCTIATSLQDITLQDITLQDTSLQDTTIPNKKEKERRKKEKEPSKKEPKKKGPLYFCISFSEEQYTEIITMVGIILSSKGIDITKYNMNKEFHITSLYLGGKDDARIPDLMLLLGQKYDINIERIGYNNDFIALGVSVPSDLPYYENPVKHITYAIRIPVEKEKLFPKDSYLSLNSDSTIILDEPYKIVGTFASR